MDRPPEIENLVRRCEANELSFTNDEMSAVLAFSDSLSRIVSRVVRNAQFVDDTTPREEPGPLCGPTWAKVSYLFGLGSTRATELCVAVGVDPHFDCARETVKSAGITSPG